MYQRLAASTRALHHVTPDGRVTAQLHLQQPFRAQVRSAESLAAAYLRSNGGPYGIAAQQIQESAKLPLGEITSEGEHFRQVDVKRIMDVTTVEYAQTLRNVAVWHAGVAVHTRNAPLEVLGSRSTALTELSIPEPNREAIARVEQITPQELARLLNLDEVAKRLRNGELAAPRITGTKRWIYRFDDDERLPEIDPRGDTPRDDDGQPQVNGFGGQQTLPLPPLPDDIEDGRDYLVVQILFTLAVEGWGALHWTVLVEPERMAVLYLRPHADGVDALVFPSDPLCLSGLASTGPDDSAVTLDPLRQNVTLLGLDAPSGGVQSLSGEYVEVQDFYTPSITAPTEATGVDFDYGSRTNDFAAANAYYHCDGAFRLLDDMGFDLATYFDGTTFPVPVDHRGSSDLDGIFGGPTSGSGDEVNAQSLGNAAGNGAGGLNFFLADTTDLANPLGIACDKRVVLHEFAHSILWDHVDSPNFGFAHSAGDSLAAILDDPDCNAPDRFETFPFTFQSIPGVSRRHDRTAAGGWGWSGDIGLNPFDFTLDFGGYNNEQILSSTMFRLYQSIGGDSGSLSRREFAARMVAYLIFRATAELTPSANADNAGEWADALAIADAGAWTSEGLSGGAYHKVIRWAFEKQGLYQAPGTPLPVDAEGAPPEVDVYIDDGRGGEYEFLGNHWSTTDIWNRTSVGDGGGMHEHPILSQTNYAYVRIKNRGTDTATNIVVKGFHCNPGVGLVYPTDWAAMDTNQLVAADLAPGAEAVIGPFEWVPSQPDHECMFFAVSALGDAANIDGGITGEIPEWRLVPNDNNIAQRNVTPVPGGGGSLALTQAFVDRGFNVRNTLGTRAHIVINSRLPEFLVERGWRLQFTSPGADEFYLAPSELKRVGIKLIAGSDFAPTDVAADDQDIDLQVAADGILLGGMRYRIDPTLKELVREAKPGDGTKQGCTEQAKRLLDCLGVPADEVHGVKVKKITVDIHLDDCC